MKVLDTVTQFHLGTTEWGRDFVATIARGPRGVIRTVRIDVVTSGKGNDETEQQTISLRPDEAALFLEVVQQLQPTLAANDAHVAALDDLASKEAESRGCASRGEQLAEWARRDLERQIAAAEARRAKAEREKAEADRQRLALEVSECEQVLRSDA
jgi:hypothetical protein